MATGQKVSKEELAAKVDKKKAKEIKDWLKDKGHSTLMVESKKWETSGEIIQSVGELTGISPEIYAKSCVGIS